MVRDPRLGLPPSIVELIDAWIAESGLRPGEAGTVRDDLEQHFRDGLTAGRTPDELIESFGDPRTTAPLLREAVRDRSRTAPDRSGRPAALFDALIADVRYAVRALRASPVYTLTVVAVLALGIGANAATFTVLNEVLLRPLPVADQGTLANVIAEVPGGNSFTGFSIADFETLRDQSDVLDGLAAHSGMRLRFGEEPVTEQVVAQLTSPGYFDLLGVPPALGSATLPAFTGWGADDSVILSHAFWQRRLGAGPDVVGRTIRLNGRPMTVIGVAREGFRGTFIGFPTDLWLPLSAAATFRPGFDPDDRSQKFLELLGRRRAGLSLERVEAGLDAVAVAIERTHPVVNRGHRVRVVALTGLDDSLRVGVTSFVAILVAVAAMVLLIACLNVGSILLVRTMTRDREIAVRIAVGAGGARLVRQLLTESALVTGAGAVVALALAAAAASALRDFVATMSGGLGLELTLDWRVLALTGGVALASAVVASLMPAAHVLRKHPAGVLRQGRGAGRSLVRARSALVVTQVSLSVVLAVSAGLFVRALGEGLRADAGFDVDRVAGFPLTLDAERFDEAAAAVLQRDVLAGVRSLPGVSAAALSSAGPLGVARTPVRVSVAGTTPPAGEDGFLVDGKPVGAGYLETVGVDLLLGRAFQEQDDEAMDRVAVVSAAFANRFFAASDPVGSSMEVDGQPVRIVGVARDVRYLLQDDTPDPLVYLSLGGVRFASVQLLFRTEAPPVEYRAAIQELLVAADPTQPPVTVRTARESLGEALLPQRVGAAVIGTMGLIAIVLASLGLYGLIQYTVTRDARALGIRMALGGGRLDALASVLRGGFTLVAVGLGVGAGLALLVTPSLGPFLAGVRPHDPRTFVTVLVTFALVGIVASFVPALRASRVDPAETLRAD